MYKKFLALPKILQILLLLIPFVNLVTELVIRAEIYTSNKNTGNLVLLVLSVITVGYLSLIDIVLLLVNGDVLRLDK